MREVPAKLYGFMREHAQAAGYDVVGAEHGLRLADIDPSRFGERVDWDEVAEFLERLYGGCSDAEIEAVGEGYLEVNAWIQLAASVLLTPRMLTKVGWEATRPSFPHWDIEVDASTDPVELTVSMPESYRGSRVMMVALVGEMRALPTLVGDEPAQVDAEVGTHFGRYRVQMASAPTWRDEAFRRGRLALDRMSDVVLDLLGVAARQDRMSPPPIPAESDLQRVHGFTPAESRVVARLIRGISVAEIATELSVSPHTVRTQLRAIFDKTGQRTQAALVSHVLTSAGGEPTSTPAG